MMSATAIPVSTDVIYKVIVNTEDQYSIWPANREVPFGWSFEGTEGSKTLCFDHIQKVWTDLRPRSVREAMGDSVPG